MWETLHTITLRLLELAAFLGALGLAVCAFYFAIVVTAAAVISFRTKNK